MTETNCFIGGLRGVFQGGNNNTNRGNESKKYDTPGAAFPSNTISPIDGASRVSGPERLPYRERESWTIWSGSFLANQACYVGDMLVATTKGAMQAKSLGAGDVVLTPNGSRIVTWSRQFTWSPAELHPEQMGPIYVRRGAIASSLPDIDLAVAPWHCLWVGNRLIPASLLINCRTVLRNPVVAAVVYCHVLFRHSALGQLAVTSECVAPIWSALSNRAKRLGYITGSANERPNRDVRLVINGRSVRPIGVSGNGWKFILPHGHKIVQLASPGNAAVVRIETITRNTHEVIPADHPNLTQGWGRCECDAEVMWRHVLGVAHLPISHIADSGVVVVYLKT